MIDVKGARALTKEADIIGKRVNKALNIIDSGIQSEARRGCYTYHAVFTEPVGQEVSDRLCAQLKENGFDVRPLGNKLIISWSE